MCGEKKLVARVSIIIVYKANEKNIEQLENLKHWSLVNL